MPEEVGQSFDATDAGQYTDSDACYTFLKRVCSLSKTKSY